jgi:hypothetical protein
MHSIFDLRGSDYNLREILNVYGAAIVGAALMFFTPGIAATTFDVRQQGTGILENVVKTSCEMWSVGTPLAIPGAFVGYCIGLGCAERLQTRRYKIHEE